MSGNFAESPGQRHSVNVKKNLLVEALLLYDISLESFEMSVYCLPLHSSIKLLI